MKGVSNNHESLTTMAATATTVPPSNSLAAQAESSSLHLDENEHTHESSQSASAWMIVATIALFIAAGFAEIGGGWLVWQSVREGRPVFWGIMGSLLLIVYGFIPTFQPEEVVDSFGRVYAIYGGFFIILAALWGWLLDGDKPDRGDLVGVIHVSSVISLTTDSQFV